MKNVFCIWMIKQQIIVLMCDMVLSSKILIDEEFNEIELQKGASLS